jgi:uncharacterized UBP type Zn finger protein
LEYCYFVRRRRHINLADPALAHAQAQAQAELERNARQAREEELVTQLVEMGFTRTHVRYVLTLTGSRDPAHLLEHLLTTPPPPDTQQHEPATTQAAPENVDVEMTEQPEGEVAEVIIALIFAALHPPQVIIIYQSHVPSE